MPNLIDMTGKRFGKLLVLALGERRGTTPLWVCKCDCGESLEASGSELRAGRYKSCGCFRVEAIAGRNTTHGGTKSPEYRVWQAMKLRCLSKNSVGYHNYGGIGITICERWLASYQSFIQDMGNRPSSRHTLERKDNSLGYSPENCVWATYTEQANNTRKNVTVVSNGSTYTVAQWARLNGEHPQTVYARIRRGQPFDQKGKPGPRSTGQT